MIAPILNAALRQVTGMTRFLSILGIHVYRLLLSPLLIGGCRHWPTCSQYAEEAIRRHGLRHGWTLAAKRIMRCRPGGSFGYDPVPDSASSSPSTLTGHPL
jgi:hypothetical protein